MKKQTILLMVSAVALIISALSFNSCTKQENLNGKQETIAPEKDYSIYNKISSFNKKMAYYKENPMYKSGESIGTDEALWLMEGGINLTYGFPFEEYGEFTTGTASITLQKGQNGEIDMDEVAIKYQELIEAARDDYYNSGYDEKGLYIVDLEKTAEDENEVVFSVETVTGDKGIDPYPFGYNDHWWYGEDEGGCGINNASSSDAAHELAETYPTYNLTKCMALAEPKSVGVTGGDSWLRRPNDVEDNNRDYYIFCVKDNVSPFIYEEDLCLEPTLMATYYNYLDYVITDLAKEHGNVPPGHEFIKFSIIKGEQFNNGQGISYRHEFVLKYGLPYYKPNCDIPIEL